MTATPSIHLIVAIDDRGAIGFRGDMPWGRSMKADLKHFKETTMGYPVLMGRTTFESFPKRPLPGRLNIVLTGRADYAVPEGAVVATSADEALRIAGEASDRLFVIGGAKVYAQFFDRADYLHMTLIHHAFDRADTYFPEADPARWTLETSDSVHPADASNAYPYSFVVLKRQKADK